MRLVYILGVLRYRRASISKLRLILADVTGQITAYKLIGVLDI